MRLFPDLFSKDKLQTNNQPANTSLQKWSNKVLFTRLPSLHSSWSSNRVKEITRQVNTLLTTIRHLSFLLSSWIFTGQTYLFGSFPSWLPCTFNLVWHNAAPPCFPLPGGGFTDCAAPCAPGRWKTGGGAKTHIMSLYCFVFCSYHSVYTCTLTQTHRHTHTHLSADGNKLSHFAEGFPCPRKSNQHDYVGLQQWQDCFALSFFLTLQYKLFVNVSDKALNRSEMWLKGRLWACTRDTWVFFVVGLQNLSCMSSSFSCSSPNWPVLRCADIYLVGFFVLI